MDSKRPSLISAIVISLIFMCLISSNCAKPDKFEDYKTKILLRGPGTCTQIILLNENGRGKAIKGRTEDYYQDNFKKLESIELETEFKIQSAKLSSINHLIDKIEKADDVNGKFANDARRIEIYINGKKKMNIYSWEPNILHDLLQAISTQIPYDINSNCDRI